MLYRNNCFTKAVAFLVMKEKNLSLSTEIEDKFYNLGAGSSSTCFALVNVLDCRSWTPVKKYVIYKSYNCLYSHDAVFQLKFI